MFKTKAVLFDYLVSLWHQYDQFKMQGMMRFHLMLIQCDKTYRTLAVQFLYDLCPKESIIEFLNREVLSIDQYIVKDKYCKDEFCIT